MQEYLETIVRSRNGRNQQRSPGMNVTSIESTTPTTATDSKRSLAMNRRLSSTLVALAIVFGIAVAIPCSWSATYTWANSNVDGTPASPLDWFTGGPNTQGAWTGGTPVSGAGNSIQFFQDNTTFLTYSATATQTSNINNGGNPFELSTLTLSGRGPSGNSGNLTMTIAGDPLQFSGATGTINANAQGGNVHPGYLSYLISSDIRLGTASSATVLTINPNMNQNGYLHISGNISELQTGGGSLVKDGIRPVVLSGQSTFSGGTTINNEWIYASGASTTVLGTGRLTINGGGFSLHTSDGQNPSNQTVGSIAGTGGKIRAGGRTLTFGGDNTDSSFLGSWEGGAFTKVGMGTTTVFGASSTVTGLTGVNINAGTLRLGASKDFGTVGVHVYGTLDLNGYNTNGDLYLHAGGAVSTGAGTFTQTAAQLYWMDSGTSTFTGNLVLPSNPNLRGDANSVLVIDGVLSGGAGNIINASIPSSVVFRLSGSSPNTFSGTWAVSGGTTELNKTPGVNAIPTDVTMTAGTLKWLASDQIADTATLTMSGGTLDLNGFNETVARLASPGTGQFTPNSAGLLTLNASSGDVISIGTGSNISKDVGLNLALSGSGGGILFTPDPVNQNRVMRIGTTTAGQRTLDLGAVDRTIDVTANSSNVNLLSGYEAQISSQITGTGGIIKNGVGDLQLTAANTFSGDTLVNAGRLIVSNNLALQNSALDTSGAGTVTLTSSTTPTLGGLKGGADLASVITSGYGSVAALTLNPGVGKTHTYSGAIANGAANMSLTKSGAGTQIFSGANSYAGATNLNAGILQANHASALGSGNIVFGGGTLQYSDASAGQDWAARFKNSASAIRLDTNGQTVTLGAIDATNSGGLIKLGGGVLTLTGANAYTGTTTVEAGTLLINGSTAAASPVVVNGGILGGSGFAGGTVTVNAGGTLAPGASIESLGSGALALNDGSTFAYELNSSVLDGDLLYVDGGVTLTGVVTLTLTELASGKLVVGDKLTLIASTDPWSGDLFSYEGSLLADGAIFELGANKWQFAYNDTLGGSNFAGDQDGMSYFITMTVIPEPSAALLLALGGLVVLRRRR